MRAARSRRAVANAMRAQADDQALAAERLAQAPIAEIHFIHYLLEATA